MTDFYRATTPRHTTQKVGRKQHMTLRIMTTEFYRTTLMPRCIATAQRQSRMMTTDFCRMMPTYDGPFLVVGKIPPSDYIIQKTQKSAPITVHKDKIKLCHGETPKSWLTISEGQGQETTQARNDPNRHLHRGQGHRRQHDQLPDSGDNILASQPVPPVRRQQTRRRSPAQRYGDLEDDLETMRTLPTRQRRLPQRYYGYQM